MPTTPPSVTALPTPPVRSDPSNFPARADAFLSSLPAFQSETNAVVANAYANAVDALASAVAAAANAAAAAASSAAGANSAAAAAAAFGAALWVSGATYALGVTAWSPVTMLVYRRIVAGAGTTDPSADGANWSRVFDSSPSAESYFFGG